MQNDKLEREVKKRADWEKPIKESKGALDSSVI